MSTRRVLPWLALVTVWFVWGSTYLGIRFAVETIPPLTMAGARFLLAGSALLAIVGPRHARGEKRPTLAHLRSALVVGALLLFGGNGLLSIGEKHLDSGLAALIVATVPVWMVLMNAAVTKTRITNATLLALGLGVAGVALLIGWRGGESISIGAAVLVLVASVSWAAGTVFARTAPLPRHPLVATALQMIAGGLLLLVIGASVGELSGFDPGEISARSMFGFVWLTVPGSMLAFSAYIYANSTLSNDAVATYAYVNPVVAVILGALIGQEAIGVNILLGGAVIIASVVIILLSPRRAREAPIPVPTDESDRLDSSVRDLKSSPEASPDARRGYRRRA